MHLIEKEICDLNENLFVGNFNALNTVIKFVLQGFPNIDASIRGQKQIYKNKNYQEILLDAFGYEKFSQIFYVHLQHLPLICPLYGLQYHLL